MNYFLNQKLSRRNAILAGSGLMLGANSIFAEEKKFINPKPAKSLIYIFVNGGLSQIDSFDPKTREDVKGPTKLIATNVDGIQISHYFPETAKIMDKCCIVRSNTISTASHFPANYIQHTNYKQRGSTRHPSLGAWLSLKCPSLNPKLPSGVAISESPQGIGTSPGYISTKYACLPIGDPDAGLQFSNLPEGISSNRQNRRAKLAEMMNSEFLKQRAKRTYQDHHDIFMQARSLIGSSELEVFDIHKEDKKVIEKYGNNQFGKGCLMARRLVEKRVRFVEVMTSGWDHHGGIAKSLDEMAPTLDRGISTLITDLSERGLLEETLVVVATEFGRTPHINVRGGRDHHPSAFSQLLAGGGIKGGTVYGETDELAKLVAKDEVKSRDFFATMAYAMGIDPYDEIKSNTGRPFTMGNKGKPLTKLFT